jgi:hypothetical protein
LGDVEAVESFYDTQVVELVRHVALDYLAYFVAFFDGAPGVGEVIHLSED